MCRVGQNTLRHKAHATSEHADRFSSESGPNLSKSLGQLGPIRNNFDRVQVSSNFGRIWPQSGCCLSDFGQCLANLIFWSKTQRVARAIPRKSCVTTPMCIPYHSTQWSSLPSKLPPPAGAFGPAPPPMRLPICSIACIADCPNVWNMFYLLRVKICANSSAAVPTMRLHLGIDVKP